MVVFELSDVGLFKEIVGVVDRYIEDIIKFELTGDGLSFTCLDKPHVVFLNCLIGNEWFSEYQIGEGVSFIVDIRELKNALGRISNSASVSCSLSDEYLVLRTVNLDANKSFKLRLVSDEYDSPKPPSIPYDGSISVDIGLLKEYTLDASLYGNKLSYNLLGGDKLVIKSENDYTMYESEMSVVNEDVSPCKVTLSSEKLVDLFKLKSLDDCRIQLGSDMPLTINLMNNSEDVLFSFMIAPRLEEDV